ncbi:MiaB/RimO family radical SAM methylthiotransferase [Novosphingobium capsulatum]|uniref:MiaB/RimO family radical SAM methylthiotransferase n=1 Tax=Novosphingobium capsulatum TaxID=13688 RepID=UPI00247FC489|nr:MiaB/RimO family radical SAM methylthiotransferase [Novosphingobium capsulatum]WQD92501.1 MiaB/RimO family radical SAM methylthiotransferase [Novosphingobium capsulatum]
MATDPVLADPALPDPAGVVTLGCRMNLSESETIRHLLAAAPTPTVVVNSCAVTAEAVRQSRRAVRRLRRDHPGARLLVTGCAATIDPAGFAAMAEVDGVVPNAAKLDPARWQVPAPAVPVAASERHTRAFVAVQNGCDHACTFCIIPAGRGASRSVPVVQVLHTLAGHLAHGVAEVVLTGVDLTSWGAGLPEPARLGDLVAAILRAFPALPRLRLSSVDGVEIDPLLLDLLCHEARVMPHVHLSLQSGADLVLKRMKRRHSRAQALALVETLRHHRPDMAIGADLIAGFPTEDAAMHAENLSIVAQAGIVHGHVFPYSPRPGTPAARMPQVPPPVVRERAAQLRAAVAQTRAAWLQGLVGRPAQVLAERDGTGHGPDFAPYRLPAGTAPGSLVTLTPERIEEGMLA